MPLRGLAMVGRVVGNREAMTGSVVGLDHVSDPGLRETPFQQQTLLVRERGIVLGARDVDLSLHLRGQEVRALRMIGGEPPAVERGRRGHPFGVPAGRGERHPASHAVAYATDLPSLDRR